MSRGARLAGWLRWGAAARGAPLWLPCILVAAWLVLFALETAPVGASLYTHITAARVVVGSWRTAPEDEAARATFVAGLRAGLAVHGDVAVEDPVRVEARLGGVPDADPVAAIHAVRALNPHLVLTGEIGRESCGFTARIEAWDARAAVLRHAWDLCGSNPRRLGQAGADSVAASLHLPANESRAGMR